jgi:hypothetical protein
MTSFVHIDHANRLPNVARVERLADIGFSAVSVLNALVFLGQQTLRLTRAGAGAVNRLSLSVAQSRTERASASQASGRSNPSSKESS